MATSSILGGSTPPEQLIPGKDTRSLGPGDSSDTGSDTLGAYSDEALASDSDAAGTGERAGIIGDERPDADILPDQAVDEADLLGGAEGEGEGDMGDSEPDRAGGEGTGVRAQAASSLVSADDAEEDVEENTAALDEDAGPLARNAAAPREVDV